ncbi:MAG: hypothetical protein HY558_04170 [Euryarchaeota archaeon]|nr:hypothetical protein [Euryarchaeota archaeon]
MMEDIAVNLRRLERRILEMDSNRTGDAQRLEKRVEGLQQEIAQVKAAVAPAPGAPATVKKDIYPENIPSLVIQPPRQVRRRKDANGEYIIA